LSDQTLFWKKVSRVGTIQPGAWSGGEPYSLKMPPTPHAGQAVRLQSMMAAGLKSMVFRVISTFSVSRRQPFHQSRACDPLLLPR
jgi:hypothetical protein